MGFHVCSVCSFQNFKRLSFCSLCGTKLNALTEGPQPRRAVTSELTQRQRRARSRRAWTRKLDLSGTLFWYQAGHDDTTIGSQQRPGFVLGFEGDAVSTTLDDECTSEMPAEFEANDLEAAKSQVDSVSATDADRHSLVAIEVFPPDVVPLPPAAVHDVSLGPSEAQLTQLIESTPAAELSEPPTTSSEALISGSETPTNSSSRTPSPAEHTPVVPTESVALHSRRAVVRHLDMCASLQTLVLTPFALADAAQLPLRDDESHRSIDNWRPVLAMASEPFPTRFAHFVTTAAGLIVHRSKQYIRLKIAPESVLPDSVAALSRIPRAYIHSVIRIDFVGDHGVDVGALQREWYLLLNRELAAPANGVFKCVDTTDQTFYLNPHSATDIGADHLLYYFAAGRLVGRSLLDGQVLSFHLALPLLKILLGVPVAYRDLEYVDPEAYAGLKYLINNPGTGDLGVTFSLMEVLASGETVEVDLIDDGRNVDVTDENKQLYLDRRFRYLLFESVSSQLYAFLKGVCEIVPQDLLALFDPEELDYVLCGSDEIDVDEWEKHTRISKTMDTVYGRCVMSWFWAIVRKMPNEYRRRLLHFATGTSRVPLGGFAALTSVDGQLCPFTLKGVKLEESEYIASHACFNRLDVPLYKSTTQLESMLWGIVQIEEYGFTRD